MDLENIQFILRQLYYEFEIPMHYYDARGCLNFTCGYPQNIQDPFLEDPELCKTLKEEESSYPKLVEEEGMLYGILSLENQGLLMAGPVAVQEILPVQFSAYCRKHALDKTKFFIGRSNLMHVANLFSILMFCLKNEKTDEKEILKKNSIMVEKLDVSEQEYFGYLMDNSEQEINRLGYQYEQSWMKAISEGNLDSFYNATTTHNSSKVGTLAKKSYKQLEYMTVCSITLATRAAIDGGMNPLEAYMLSDLYLQKLELAGSQEDIYSVMNTAVQNFVQKVKQAKEEKITYSYIEKCKDYIRQNINKKIVISKMAKSIPINSSYLSRKFSEVEGITIQQFIAKEKTRAAANMLRFSEYGVAQIAQYLGFSSQSNMAKQFKEIYGMSPMTYRKQNQVVDFISSPQ